jgi:hypothetical protein
MICETMGIDPGTRALGFAGADESGRLVRAGLSKVPRDWQGSHADLAGHHGATIGRGSARVAVLESMVYAKDRATTPQDLIDVQTVGCLTASRVASQVVLRRPDEWKSAIPKEIHHPRILDVLDARERTIVDAAVKAAGKTNAKEVLDAVGILLQYLKRTNKEGAAYRWT